MGRFLVGTALGASFSAASAYIGEVAPPQLRGSLITLNEIGVCGGCLLSYAVAIALGDKLWRYSLGLAVVVAAVQLLGVLCMHESPRWLVSRGNVASAAKATRSLGIALPQPSVSVATSYGTAHKWRSLKIHRQVLSVALGCAAAHAATAANTVLYYSRDVLVMAGITQPMLANLAVGFVKLVGVLLCLALVDRLGRRALLLSGTAGIVLSLVSLAVAFREEDSPAPRLALSSLLAFILFWDMSWAGLMMTVVTEMLPQEVRGIGVGASYSLYWLLSFVQSQTLETCFRLLGVAQTFGAYALTSAFALVFTWLFVTETRGRSLESIAARAAEHEPITREVPGAESRSDRSCLYALLQSN